MPDTISRTELSPAKRRQILAGARQVFAELGFDRASVDLIATRAAVSKATIYNHFREKKALFFAAFLEESEDLRRRVAERLAASSGDLEADLREVGEHFLEVVLSPSAVALHRIMVAEAARFPELGQCLFDNGAAAMRERMASYLERWRDAGALTISEPAAAAVQFLAMCQGDLTVRAHLGVAPPASPQDVRASVERAVRTFVRAHRP